MWSSAIAGEHPWYVCTSDQRVSPFVWETSGPLPFAWATSWPLPFAWASIGSLPGISTFSPKLQTLYYLFKSHAEVWTSSSRHVFFCLWLFIGTYILPFFPVICWSYQRTEISVALSISNKLYSSPFSIFSALLMLSCDRLETAKFIIGS